MKKLRILNLEDDPLDAELIRTNLAEGRIACEITRVGERDDFLAALQQGDFDLILADYSLPSFDGLSALKIRQEISPGLPFILVSGTLGEEAAIESLTSGATDYVLKHRLERLVPAVRRAMREAEERAKRERAEKELRESEERFRRLAEGINFIPWEADLSTWRFTYVGPQAVEILGYPLADWYEGDFWVEHIHPDDREWTVDFCTRSSTSDQSYRFEYRMLASDGRTVWLDDIVQATTDQDGQRRLRGVMIDITERKEAEEALREVRESERRRIARDLHDGVLQDLSYTLRSMEATKAKSEDAELASELGGEIDLLRRSVRGVRDVIYDLRLEEAEQRPFVSLLESMVEESRQRSPGCEIELSVEEEFPAHLAEGAKAELLRIVREALVNARHHAEARHVRVTVGTSEGMPWAEVEDDGRSFDPEEVAGMGIKGMRERARILGGELKIESKPGGGTKVRFEPASTEVQEEPQEEIRVLLVEDHASFREAIGTVFDREPGFTVVGQAGSLSEARENLEGVEVAIVDLALPDGYGGELIKELREKNPQAQVLVLSASLDRAEIARAVESGAAGVLHKSASMEEVVEAVRRLGAGDTLLSLEEIVELLRFVGFRREQEYEARRAIARLTPREREVLEALAEGLDGQQIAGRLSISIETERNHMASILTKLGVHSRLQALVFALRHGVVGLG